MAYKKKGGNSKSSRTKYWQSHDKPTKLRHAKVTGMYRRLRRGDMSILQMISDLGQTTEAAVARLRKEDLKYNRAFAQHEDRVRAAIRRFRRLGADRLPHRVETAIHKSAFQAIDEAMRKRRVS